MSQDQGTSCQDQGQGTHLTAASIWKKNIDEWYPELLNKTYFLPPLHFNRVRYDVVKIAGQSVLIQRNCPDPEMSQSVSASKASDGSDTSSKTVVDSDLRGDLAQERVLECLRSLAESCEPKEVMMVVSQLGFGKYLHKPIYSAFNNIFPKLSDLPNEYRRGDFDVLIIHRNRGLIIGEIKNVGATFTDREMTEQSKDASIGKKIKRAVEQLNKGQFVLKHLVSDVNINVSKVLMLPNLQHSHLLRVLERDETVANDLCTCLGAKDFVSAADACLCSDMTSQSEALRKWWHNLLFTSVPTQLEPTLYRELVARFCGPATTVDVFSVSPPRLEIRTEAEAVSETGERMSRIVLTPKQIEFLNLKISQVFLVGPPGVGKTIMLLLQGLIWLQEGHDVHVVSTWRKSRASSFVIEHELTKTIPTWITETSGNIHRHMFDFEVNRRDVQTAVKDLSQRAHPDLYIIADEAGPDMYRNEFQMFCDQLISKVPTVFLWAAAVQKHLTSKLYEVTMTLPLRSPPVVVREITKAPEISELGYVRKYSPMIAETDGPSIRHIVLLKGRTRHKGKLPRNCEQCGREVAQILTALRIGFAELDTIPKIPPLQYRDVLLLRENPSVEHRDSNPQTVPRTLGIVRGLMSCGVPVNVVENNASEATIRDIALAVKDEVTLASRDDVRGLERKVVIVEKHGDDMYHTLQGPSRCSSQLIYLDY